jgi:hypothetical protein
MFLHKALIYYNDDKTKEDEIGGTRETREDRRDKR